MKKNKHVTLFIYSIAIMVIHLILYSSFYLEAGTYTHIYPDSYLKYIISDNYSFESSINILLLSLRTNLLFGSAILFVIMPLLKSETVYKKVELIFHGSYRNYIRKNFMVAVYRTILIVLINVFSIVVCNFIYNTPLVTSPQITSSIIVYTLMVMAFILLVALLSIIASIHITVSKLILSNIVALSILLIIDLSVSKLSLIYYQSTYQMLIGLSIFGFILLFVMSKTLWKGKRK